MSSHASIVAGGALLLASSWLLPAQAQEVLQTYSLGYGVDDAVITPNGRYAILRENQIWGDGVKVIDLESGAIVFQDDVLPWQGLSGVCFDAVAANDARAIVIGSPTRVLDLATGPFPILLGELDLGLQPRDVELTPDGRFAVVAGGQNLSSHLVDLSSGTIAGTSAGTTTPWNPSGTFPYSIDVDAVAATDTHAVVTSYFVYGGTDYRARVTIWELSPAGGGPPQVAYQTSGNSGPQADQPGVAHDLAITPDGRYAAVRSEDAVALYDLTVSPPVKAWERAPDGGAGAFHDEVLDSLLLTNARIYTLGNSTPANGSQAQLDVFDLAGNGKFDRLSSSPHDFALNSDGTRLVVRTMTGVWLYDALAWPAGSGFPELDSKSAPGNKKMYLAGLDSVAVGLDRAVTCSTLGFNTHVYFWDISGSSLVPIAHRQITGAQNVDVELAPDGEKVYVSATSKSAAFQVRTGELIFEDTPGFASYFPWCDGAVVADRRAVVFGYRGPLSNYGPQGWSQVAQHSPLYTNYCPASANSTGAAGRLIAMGSASVAPNHFALAASNLPPNSQVVAKLSLENAHLPFGDGTLCLGGLTASFRVQRCDSFGNLITPVDLAHPPSGAGSIAPGTTWNFQALYRDLAASASNTTSALSVTFEL